MQFISFISAYWCALIGSANRTRTVLQMAMLFIWRTLSRNYNAIVSVWLSKDPPGQAGIRIPNILQCTLSSHQAPFSIIACAGSLGTRLLTSHLHPTHYQHVSLKSKLVHVLTLVFQLGTTVHLPVIYCQCLVDCFHCVGYYQMQALLSRDLKNKFRRQAGGGGVQSKYTETAYSTVQKRYASF